MAFTHQLAEQQAIFKPQGLMGTPVVEALHVTKHHRLYQPHARTLTLGALHQQTMVDPAQQEGYSTIA
ncbi:MAG: hypothetical protein CVU30_16060 [Betaproteobacteria bacterium HGW-Betaproteobacteria-3]|nr:MAG: hypothetical protein CVU30_16060 [Betaproteobacteria bacterium HGW-Betaproteobacteria-3]